MAFSTYSSLKSMLTTWLSREDLAEYAGDFITMATGLFNRRLRCREMLTTVTRTPVSGIASLPGDYLEYVRVADNNGNSLSFMAQDAAIQAYAANYSGLAAHFTIVGNEIHVFPSSTDQLTFVYYAKIPELSAEQETNWLLTAWPEAYLRAATGYAADFIRDDQQAQKYLALSEQLISEIRTADTLSQYAKAGTWTRGVTP